MAGSRIARRFCGISELDEIPGAAVVIDVLRAFTTAGHVLDRGAERIVLAADVDHAVQLKQAIAGDPEALGPLAIKDTPPFDGFEYVNSPEQLSTADVAGRTVIQLTVNGTVGAHAASSASPLLCASFAVASATAAALLAHEVDHVTFVITGHDGAADEDLACAEYMAELIDGRAPDPGPYLARVGTSRAANGLRSGLDQGYTGIREGDIAMAAEVDRFAFAMLAQRGSDGLQLVRHDPSAPTT